MKSTKEQEAEVIPIYHEWWHSYLNGDVKTYEHYLDDDYRFVGSTVAEDFLNKSDTTQFFDATADQLAGKTQKRNSKLTTEYYDGVVFITELADAYLLFGDEWTFYGKFRFSSMLRKRSDGWRFIYQHFSVPDSKAQEGETIGFEQVSKENQELRDAIKRRTAELENKNRELEIESALDRVRSASMVMKKSDQLASVARTVFEQLKTLGVDVYRSWIDIFHANEGYVLTWSTDFEGNFQSNPATFPLDFDETMSEFYKDYKSTSKFIELEAHGDEVREWFDYLYSVSSDPIFKIPSVPDDLYQIWAKHKYGTVATTKLSPITNDEKDILNRFANVFEQAYTRFLDLQKAEAQAREAQIEMALEKVRSRTMAMQNSDELIETSELMFEQIKNLDIELWSCGFSLWYDDDSYFIGYNPGPEGKMGKPLRIPLTEDVFFTTIREAKRRGEEFLVFESEGKSLEQTYHYMDGLPVVGETMRGFVEAGYPLPTYQVTHCGFFSEGHLMFITQEPNPEAIDIFKRFTKVFEQTYTRFLDLQKAEAQAREAKIETALEKVRSRTMAMQKGEELQEVAVLLYKELIALGVTNFVTCGYVEVNEDIRRQHTWVTAPGGDTMGLFHLPLTGDDTFDARYAAWKKQQTVFHQSVAGQVRSDHLEYAITTFNSKEAEEMVRSQFPDPTVFYCFNFQHGYLHTVGGSLLEKEEENLLARFTKVFEQTYTRFLDLQKAEAQAREASIEMSLEKIRSRTMGMQNSEELPEVANMLFLEVQELGIPAWSCGYCILEEDRHSSICIMSSEGTVQKPFLLPHIGETSFEEWDDFIHSNETFFTQELGGESIDSHYNFMKSLPQLTPIFKEIQEAGLSLPEYQINHLCKFNHGFLLFITYEKVPNAHDIFKRFTKVFNQTYTRFLDLKKAEAQAREAQIEAALERVRSRSLAMHKTDELQEVVRVVAEELKNTGVILDTGGAVICTYFQDSKDVIHWTATEETTHPSVPYLLPYFKDKLFDEAWASKNKGDDYFAKEFLYDVKNTFWNYAFEHSDYRQLPDEYKKIILESKSHGLAWAWSKNSAIMIPSIKGDLPSEDEKEILIRFAKVFEQSYIRFLDLQKAEEQAREAQIENALERVRAKAMSMQNSDELDEVLSVLCEQFDVLGILPMSTHMTVFDFENNTFTFRETGKYGDRSFGEQTVDIDAMDNWKQTVDKWKEDKATDINRLHFPKEQLPKVWKVFHESFASMPEESRITPDDYPDGIYHTAGKHPFGYIGMNQTRPATEEEEEIVIKFSNEFGRAYQRFLDLQKAEKQAYESKVESSLERVRGMAAAMNHSDDLMQIAEAMFKEMEILKINPLRYGLGMINGEKKEAELWASTVNDGHYLDMLGTLSLTWHPMLQQTLDAWDGQHEEMIYELKGTELSDYYQKVGQINPDIPNLEQLQDPDTDIVQFASFFPFKTGALYAFTNGEPSNEGRSILKRFANVFEQAHIRYNDLQTAEKQARMIREERDRLEITLKELEATQEQLVQQEKLASLGQLTAGIAHEIKNPLNFVNNFSDLSVELVQETKDELSAISDQLSAEDQERVDEALEILNDIEANLKKVHEHGSRADSIVKSMLEHSRGGTGKPEDTDLNSLVKEYVNLSFHGMRASKTPINVDLQFELEDSVKDVPLIAEDFSRVIVNLSNNAFDAMKEKLSAFSDQASASYKPKLTIRTSSENGKVAVEIEDNGPGITEEMKDKILQPFFTTKKGTQGTGLGLSITNDIIKAHGGTLQISSSPEGPTIFQIMLNK